MILRAQAVSAAMRSETETAMGSLFLKLAFSCVIWQNGEMERRVLYAAKWYNEQSANNLITVG